MNRSARQFQTTNWSLVVSAAGESLESLQALEELCSAYWPPLYSYARRMGYVEADAKDLTQAFFLRLLDKGLLERADSRRGRFRTFLLTSLRRFMVNEWKYRRATKRGGKREIVNLGFQEGLFNFGEPAHEMTPERVYDRNWALTVLQRAYSELESEMREVGNASLFEMLAPCLAREPDSPSYQELAAQLDSTADALKMRASRLRKRLGEIIRAEIRKTVASDDDVEDEIRTLLCSLQS